MFVDAHEACNRASLKAGPSDAGWNMRFVEALKAQGYQLLPIAPRRWDDVMAPLPYYLGEKYPYPSIIVKSQK